jgi:hypothetical protein
MSAPDPPAGGLEQLLAGGGPFRQVAGDPLTRILLITVMTALAVLLLTGGPAIRAEGDDPLQVDPLPPALQQAPLIEIPQPIHHAGPVVRGEEYSTTYAIRNSGAADLRVVKADGHCSCISTEILNPVIPPGEEGGVKITFVGRSGMGETTRIIELTSNDPQNRLVKLTFSAQVVVPFGFETRALALGKMHQQAVEPVSRRAILLIREPVATGLAGLETSSPDITARLVGSGEAREGHQRLEIEVAVQPGLPPGILQETVTATAASGNLPPAVLNITGLITGDVEVTPSELRLLVVETGNRDARKSWKRVYITGHSPDRPLRIFDCRDSSGLLRLELEELIKGEKFELTVTLDVEALDRNSEVAGTISISTNSPTQPEVSVAYSAARRLYDQLDRVEEKEAPAGAGEAAGDG